MNRTMPAAIGLPAMASAAYLATVPLLIGWFLPFVVAGFAATMGFTDQQSGFLVSADMLGYTVATCAASPLLGRVDWRRACVILLMVVAGANLVACQVSGITALLVVRLCAGLASGGLAAIGLAACAQGDDPGSAFGLWQTFQAIAAAGAGFALPSLIDRFTTRAAFVSIAILALLGLPLVRLIPRGAIKVRDAVIAGAPQVRGIGKIALAILAVFLFLSATTAITAFVERIGVQMAVAPQTIGYALAAAGVASLAGGLLATKMGESVGYVGPTIAGCVAASVAYMSYVVGAPGVATLFFGSVLYFGAYSYVAAYFMGALAVADSSGRAAAVGNGALGAGITLGPALGGWILGMGGSTIVLCYVATGMTVLSLIFALPLDLDLRSPRATPQAIERGGVA